MGSIYIPIIRLLRARIDELAAPLDAAQAEFYGEHTDRVQDSLDLIIGELIMTVLLFSSVDGIVDNRELDLINDMREVVHGHNVPRLASHDYKELCGLILNTYSTKRFSADHVPISVQVLMSYDKKHGSEYAEKARDLFIRFVDAIVEADNNEHPIETVLLGHFKEVLVS